MHNFKLTSPSKGEFLFVANVTLPFRSRSVADSRVRVFWKKKKNTGDTWPFFGKLTATFSFHSTTFLSCYIKWPKLLATQWGRAWGHYRMSLLAFAQPFKETPFSQLLLFSFLPLSLPPYLPPSQFSTSVFPFLLPFPPPSLTRRCSHTTGTSSQLYRAVEQADKGLNRPQPWSLRVILRLPGLKL